MTVHLTDPGIVLRRRRSCPRWSRAVLAASALLVSFAMAGCSSGPAPSIATPTSAEPSLAGGASPSPAVLPVAAGELADLRGPWSPTPFTLPQAAIDIVDRACRSTYTEALDGLELAIVDARGGGIVNAWYVGTTGGNYGCEGTEIDPWGALVPAGFATGTDASDAIPTVAANEVVAWYGTHREAPIGTLASAGLIGSSIAQVRFTSEGKPAIVATIMNGWFAIWLPDDWGARLTLRGYDDAGVEVFANLDW